jgi:hypothetical protein
VNGDRYQVDTVGGRGGFAERGERGGVFGVAGLSGGSWLLQGRLAASFGRCRSLWRQLAAAGPSGGEFWPLQVSLAAIGCCRAVWRQLAAAGPCKAVALAPLLMVLLLWNILSAIFKLCCFSSDSLQVAVSFCVVSNKNRNDTKLQFSVCILTRWCC